MKRKIKKNWQKYIFIFPFIIGLATIYFSFQKSSSFQGQSLDKKQVRVTKVIDGDTIVVEGGNHIRFLGIDTDEFGYPCFQPAKDYLEKLILNKTVILEKDKTDKDKYHRYLRHVFFNKENINVKLVKNGLAIASFFYPDIKYQKQIQQAEKQAQENKKGCKWK